MRGGARRVLKGRKGRDKKRSQERGGARRGLKGRARRGLKGRRGGARRGLKGRRAQWEERDTLFLLQYGENLKVNPTLFFPIVIRWEKRVYPYTLFPHHRGRKSSKSEKFYGTQQECLVANQLSRLVDNHTKKSSTQWRQCVLS